MSNFQRFSNICRSKCEKTNKLAFVWTHLGLIVFQFRIMTLLIEYTHVEYPNLTPKRFSTKACDIQQNIETGIEKTEFCEWIDSIHSLNWDVLAM